MKKNKKHAFLFSVLFIGLASIFFQCKDKVVQEYQANVPVYKTVDQWRKIRPTFGNTRVLDHPGKIYIYRDHLYIVERMKGIHVFDNTNPSNPINLGFLPIYTCTDLAASNGYLYANSYFDILTFNVSNPGHPVYESRQPDAFNFDRYTELPGLDSNYPVAKVEHPEQVIVGWEVQTVREDKVQTYYPYGSYVDVANGGSSASSEISFTGQGGSMAQFTFWKQHLYTVKDNTLQTFQAVGSSLNALSSLPISRTVETIFPYKDHLFLGTRTGMLVYEVQNSAVPTFLTNINHVFSCDPVVVSSNRAYLTLSSNSPCRGVNALHVLDLSNYSNPQLLETYALTNPQGLGVDGNALFICDGSDGLKIYDRSVDNAILSNELAHFPGITTYDVIPYNGVLILTGTEGIYQYDYSDLNNIRELSFIPAQ